MTQDYKVLTVFCTTTTESKKQKKVWIPERNVRHTNKHTDTPLFKDSGQTKAGVID